MRCKRLLHGAFWVVMAPLIVGAVCAMLVVVLLILAGFGIFHLVKLSWNNLPRHRRALRLAGAFFADRYPHRIAADWHVWRRRRNKCFVRARLAGISQPSTLWLCAVWDESGQIDDLGTWQFQHGIDVRHAVRAYETAKTAGQDWPTGLAQFLQTVPAAQLPSAAQPGLHPHEGSVLVVDRDRIAFYQSAETANSLIDPARAGSVAAFDADFRRLYFDRQKASEEPRILAPIPPTPRDKLLMEQLRHYLISQESDEAAKETIRQMKPGELVEYGLQHLGELDDLEEMSDSEFE